VTPAQAETTPAKGTLARNLPPEMWEAIHRAEAELATSIGVRRLSLRDHIIALGQCFNFEENELIARGVIAPRREPPAETLKGGH
jgi:hypothetical protein